ncbi:MAG: hypothetical protein GY945_12315 [Rhodobacteraceae bacterium]|nr:hypothetical protein [Paracoccaceae bacterium]
MKMAIIGFGAAAISLIATVAMADETGFTRIVDESGFIGTVTDREITSRLGTLIIGSDGKVTGSVPIGKVTGSWNWDEGYWCRTVKIGFLKQSEDCQSVEVSPTEVRFAAEKGTGKAVLFSFN